MWAGQTRRTVLASGAAAPVAPRGRAGGYAEALAEAYGGPVDARAAHGLAVREAGRLQARADVLLRRMGLRQGSVGERLRAFAADPAGQYPDSDGGRAAAVADMNAA